MPIYNTTMFFAGRGEGWSETHQLSTGFTTPIECFPIMQALAAARANLLGLPYNIIGFRVSAYTIDGLTRAPRSIKSSRQVFVQSPQCMTGQAEPGPVALLMQGATAPGTQTNISFLGAPADDAVTAGGQVQRGQANLGGNFNSYAQLLLAPGAGSVFGWGKSNSGDPININSITANVNGTVRFVLNNAAAFVAPFAKQFPARCSGINGGKSLLNGALNVVSVNATSCDSTEMIAFTVDQINGKMRLYPVIRPFTPYRDLSLADYVGNHKRGRPFGSRRGRAPKRIRA